MKITKIYSFLVHPSKNLEKQPDVGGVEIPLTGKLFDMIEQVFQKAHDECYIDVAFVKGNEGKQENERRTELLGLLKKPGLSEARKLAKALQMVTTNRSGLGLFFVVLGSEGSNGRKRIYLSRFPADFGIIAEEENNELKVELIERVFMKSAVSYKAIVFDGKSHDSDFWTGLAVDKQILNQAIATSGYWIRDFLLADFKTTPALGTRRLAIAIKQTMESTGDMDIKEELSAAATLSKALNGQIISMSNFGERFCLSKKTTEALSKTLANPNLAFTQFQFATAEFKKHVKFHSIQMNTGALLTAPAGKFEECFERSEVHEGGDVTYSTTGSVVDERLRKSK